MDTKKYFKKIVCVAVLAIAGLVFSFSSALADASGVAINSDGSFTAGWGSNNQALNSVLGQNQGYSGWMSTFSTNPYGLPDGGAGGISGIISNILFWLLALFAIFGIIGFVISGIFYLVAAGDEGTMEKGKDGMKWSIIGIIVGLSGFVIMKAVMAMLSGSSTTF
jgi:hypothetical protein